MAENIKLNTSIFCIGPQFGTYCCLNNEAAPVTMQVKNSSGTLIRTYTFSPNDTLHSTPYIYTVPITHNEPVAIKYVGPKNQDSTYDSAIFYTLEKIPNEYTQYYTYARDPDTGDYKTYYNTDNLIYSSELEYSGNIIRKWRINNDSFTLDLVSSFYKYSDSVDWFSSDSFAIQTYQTTLLDHIPSGTGEIYFTTTSGLSKYDAILIGPSSDTDNPNAVEEAYIHSIDGDTVNIRTYGGADPTIYEYVEGDPVTIIKYAYMFSSPRPLMNADNKRYAFDSSGGTLFTLDLNSYCDVVYRKYGGMFSDINASVWNHYYNTLSFVKGCNLIHYDLAQEKPTQSQFLHNMYEEDLEVLVIYEVDINGYDIYRLQDKMVFLDDEGRQTFFEYSSYNYIADSLELYSSTITVYAVNTCVGYQGTSTIVAIVRDQYGVGLSAKEVSFSIEEDTTGVLYPADGNVVTDSDGVCSLQYTAGAGYMGQAILLVKAVGANTVFGSQYVTGKTKVTVFSNYSEELPIKSIERDFYKPTPIMCKSGLQPGTIPLLSYVRRSMYGGEWEWYGKWNYDIINPTIYDRNSTPFSGSKVPLISTVYQPFFNNIVTNALGEITSNPKILVMPRTTVIQHYAESDYTLPSESIAQDKRYISQNYLSRHLSTGNIVSATLNQFSFTQEAIPEFWSERNQPNISYWIRLRPYSYSLDPETLEIFMYEVSWAGTTKVVDIAPLGSITLFDAGSGLSGIDFNYDFPTDFHNNATVFIEVVVYDQAPLANIITVSYWFTIIPDYTRPYIENRVPAIEVMDVPINTDITFDILDKGDGVDISTLELFINNKQSSFSFIEYEPGQFNVSCVINKNFVYGQEVKISISVNDLSDNSNLLLDSWIFYCASSTGPWFDEDKVFPGRCLEGVDRTMADISAQVYAINSTGINYDSLKLDVGGKYRNIKITPIIYRLK